MLSSVDWKWLIVGLIAGWLLVPMVQAFLLRRRAAAA